MSFVIISYLISLCCLLSSVCESVVLQQIVPLTDDTICLKCNCEYEIRNTWLITVCVHVCHSLCVCVCVCVLVSHVCGHACECMCLCVCVCMCVCTYVYSVMQNYVFPFPLSLLILQTIISIALIVMILIAIYVFAVFPLLQLFFKLKGKKGIPQGYRPVNEVCT